MSIHVISWVLENSPATLIDRLVLISLADHAHKDGSSAHPSNETMAHEARCSVRSVKYATTALEEAGCITQTGWTEHGTKTYRVEMTDSAARATFAPRPRAARVAPGGATERVQRVQREAKSRSRVAPEPSVNQRPTVQNPPRTQARAHDGGGGAGIVPIHAERAQRPPTVEIPKGVTPRERSRLERTAARTGATIVDHDRRTG